jgi:uncharacterized membrane protein (DUF373 family)
MNGSSRKEDIIGKVEHATVAVLQVLVILSVVVATLVLFVLFFNGLRTQLTQVDAIGALIPMMQKSFAGILIVVLGLELLETLKTYFTEHRIRLEVILVVAIIAVSRHLIQVDFEHTSASVLLGLSAVIVSLTLGYFLVKKAHDRPEQEQRQPSEKASVDARSSLPVENIHQLPGVLSKLNL